MTTTPTVGIFLTEDERRHLTQLCSDLEVHGNMSGQRDTPQAQQLAALRKLMHLPVASSAGFVPTSQEREILGRIHDGAPPVHIGDLTQRLAKRILAVACPAQSNECAIRGMCTNKCGLLMRCEVGPRPGTWICPTCGDPKCGEV